MSRFHALAIALVAALSGTVVGLAAESDIKLKPGTGLDVVQSNCAACHSLDYIVINSPFLDAPGWQAEVTKMVNAYAAPIEKADQDKIAAYLAANYAK